MLLTGLGAPQELFAGLRCRTTRLHTRCLGLEEPPQPYPQAGGHSPGRSDFQAPRRRADRAGSSLLNVTICILEESAPQIQPLLQTQRPRFRQLQEVLALWDTFPGSGLCQKG